MRSRAWPNSNPGKNTLLTYFRADFLVGQSIYLLPLTIASFCCALQNSRGTPPSRLGSWGFSGKESPASLTLCGLRDNRKPAPPRLDNTGTRGAAAGWLCRQGRDAPEAVLRLANQAMKFGKGQLSETKSYEIGSGRGQEKARKGLEPSGQGRIRRHLENER